MEGSPERESKRPRLIEPSSSSDSSPASQPDVAFLEAIESLSGPYSNETCDLGLYNTGTEVKDTLSNDDVASFNSCAALHGTMGCQDDPGTQVDEAGNNKSYDTIDVDYGIVCFGEYTLS